MPRPTRTRMLLVWILLAAAAAAGAPGCKKKNSFDGIRFIVKVPDDLKPEDATITVGGKPLDFSKDSSPYVDFYPADALPPSTPAVVTVPTPCGKQSISIASHYPPNESNTVDIDLRLNKDFPVRTRLLFDPEITSPISIGQIIVPSPPPKELDVVFAACPRTIKVGAREATLPSDARVFVVGDDPQTCYRSGEVLFGPADGGCRPESSKDLTGQLAYPLQAVPTHVFEGVPTSKMVYGKCLNVTYLQRCR